MNKENHGDIVANTLDFYRERVKENDSQVPEVYLNIQDRLNVALASGKRVLINVKDSYSLQTVVLKLEYVHDRWAMGRSVCYLEGEEVHVPYSIHYSDIYCKKMKVKVILEGENPFD